MFGFNPSLEDLESKATEMASAFASATTALTEAEAADTDQGSAATWKALQSAREQHDRAQRRNRDAQQKLAAERARVAATEQQAKREECEKLLAKLLKPATSYLVDEIAELKKLDLQLEALIKRFESRHEEQRADYNRCKSLGTVVGVDVSQLGEWNVFDPQTHAQRALSIARQARREDAFEAGDATNRRDQHQWLQAAPAAIAPGL